MNARRAAKVVRRSLAAALAAAAAAGHGAAIAQNGALGIARPAAGITVDGNLDDWPAGLTVYPVTRVESGDEPKNADDFKAGFRLACDPAGRVLFVALEVRDDSLVLDKPGEAPWDGQDGCEIFVDAATAPGNSRMVQFARYGGQDRVVGGEAVPEVSAKVAVARADGRIVYEWRVDLGAGGSEARVIGFDLSVADKDADGSFSWAAWGSGTQKMGNPDRVGEVLLLGPEVKLGAVSGRLAWDDGASNALPGRVRIASTRTPSVWRSARVAPDGAYKAADVPAGPYEVRAADSPRLRVEEGPHVDVTVEPGREATADLLEVKPVPWPGLVGKEGVLASPGPFDADAMDRLVKAYLAYYKTPGISVAAVKNFEVVYRKGFGVRNAATNEPVTADTVFEAASMTKPLFAYTVLRLVDRGVLDLDTPLHTYLPYEDIAHDDRYKLITARMVLTHRTGFPNWRTGKLDIKFTPGTQVSYSGEGFVYLGKAVEKLTGKTVVELCRDEVFTPLGMDHASLVWTDDVGRLTATGHAGTSPLSKWRPTEPNTAASLHVDAGTYAKFLISAVRGVGLSDATGKEMLRSQVAMPDSKNASWGLGIGREETEDGVRYGHGGRNVGFTSQSWLDQKTGNGFVFLVNNDDAQKFDNVLNAYLVAGKRGFKEPGAVSHRPVKVDPKVFDAYAGRYELAGETVLTVARDGDFLTLRPRGEPAFEIVPESETAFFVDPAGDDLVTFVKDGSGKVTHMVVHRGGRDARATRVADEGGK